MPRPALKTRATLLSCARAYGRFGHIGLLDYCARELAQCRRPRATRVSHPRPLPAPRPRPSLPLTPPPLQLTSSLRRAQGQGARTFCSTLVVKYGHYILAGGVWQHDEAVLSQIGRVPCVCYADTVQLCVRVKFGSLCGRRIGLNAHVGAPIGCYGCVGGPAGRPGGARGARDGLLSKGLLTRTSLVGRGGMT